MSRYLHGFLILLLLLAFFGCGGGEGSTSGDPLGTDSIKVEASVTSLGAGDDSVITATVERLNKQPATDRLVSFRIITNNSGGTFRVVNDKVSGQGKAVAIYTAGTKDPDKYAEDTIQASITNGASAAVTIARSKVRTKPYTAQLTALPPTVTANQSSVITAVVKEATIDQVTGTTIDIPVSGVTVFFSIPARNTGWPALSTYSGVSDGNGVVTTVYSPGNASPTDTVNDTVQASLADGSSRAVVITRTGATPKPSTSTLTITADPASVTVPNGGGTFNTVLTAMVKDQNGYPISGVTVNITATPGGAVAPLVTGNDGKVIHAYTTPAPVTAGSIVFTAQAPALNISASTSVLVTEMP
jgi:adhesin/invasin